MMFTWKHGRSKWHFHATVHRRWDKGARHWHPVFEHERDVGVGFTFDRWSINAHGLWFHIHVHRLVDRVKGGTS